MPCTGANGDDVAGPGNGVVDEYDLNGNLLMRFASGGGLNSPWGLARAPGSFGAFANDLLVGNFGDGEINAFDFSSGSFVDALNDESGNPLSIDGLWGLRFGNGENGGNPGTLYVTAGPDEEQHGLFAAIVPVP